MMRKGEIVSPEWLFNTISRDERDRLLAGRHHNPHSILGAHPVADGVVVRAMHPSAVGAACRVDGDTMVPLKEEGGGMFAGFLPGATLPLVYRVVFHFADGTAWEHDHPYRFLPTIGELDLHLFREGNHRRLWQCLGAHQLQVQGVDGVRFAVWAPNAGRVSVVGDFCRWDGRVYPMRSLGDSGIYELFIPGVHAGALYKFELLNAHGEITTKADPMAFGAEPPPGTASRVVESSYRWGDAEWLALRRERDVRAEPMSAYEVHIGSWDRMYHENGRPLTYREIAPRLAEHLERFAFTHVEVMPVSEHPFTGSWGYQVSSYFAPTARYGTPDDFRYFVDCMHQHGIGVILDWVPAHFPKDEFALARFDGTALYEHEDPRLGEHPDWGTAVFNYGRPEVKNFLTANALYWLEEFHIDGLRVDAVASMLYLDYSREEGQWIPNEYGGREDLDAIAFLKATNAFIRDEHPDCFTVAEESTAWPGVTRSVEQDGLGFTLKWNMGWMHDTLEFFKNDPVHRKYHHDMLTFSMLYEYTEHFVMPLSHDEVVHGKGSLLSKLPGDRWQQFANLRALLAYQYTRPGKLLLFMGTELAPDHEWHHDAGLDWSLANDPLRAALQNFLADLGHLYRNTPALWRRDGTPEGFAWIDCEDRDNSVYVYERRGGDQHVVIALNLTPVPRYNYRVGAPTATSYVQLLSSDDAAYGGSSVETYPVVETAPIPWQGREHSMVLNLPPLGALILGPQS